MSRSRVFVSLSFLLVILGFSSSLRAQTPAAAMVTVNGSVEIKRQPEILRVQIELMARGKTLTDAIGKLKSRKEEVRTTLVEFGAKKDAITFGETNSADELSGRQGEINRMVRGRNRALGKPAGKEDTSSIVAGVVQVEFALPKGNPDDFLVASLELQTKIKNADLGGLKEKGKLSQEEQEAIEEAAGRSGRGDEGPARGEPVFLYVCKISEEDRSKALAAAFAKAKRDAERLAHAAGSEVGGLNRLTNPFPAASDDDQYMLARRGYYGGAPVVRSLDTSDEDSSEAVGSQPGKVSLRVGVVAEFSLKPPSNK
jgi:uncharacterized protein YggE